MPYEAELSKLNELLTNSHSNASLKDRQAFQEYLLYLASLPSYDMKSRFAIHIHRTFATFDQDQDPVIDAVMDLCEDKDLKIRILGIRALRSTATADTRWVKGNVGVLLQLLDSSGEELREVHKALKSLISVDPIVAFQSIAKDLLSDDAGVSRSKVIRFLWEEAKPERREILESGKNVSAEHAFQKAFEEVRATLKRGSDDWQDVNDMLYDLSIRRRRRSPSPRRESSYQRPRSPVPPSRPDGPSGYLPPRGDDRFRQNPPSAPPTGPRRDIAPTGPAGSRPRSPPRGPSGPASYARDARAPPAGPRHSGGGPSYPQSSSGYRDNRPLGPGYRPGDYPDRPVDHRGRGRADRSPRQGDRYPSGPSSRYRHISPDRHRSNDPRARSPDRPHHDDRRSRSRTRSPPRRHQDDSRDRARRSSPPREATKREESVNQKLEIPLDSRVQKPADVKSNTKPKDDPTPSQVPTASTNGGGRGLASTQIRGVSSLPTALPEDQKPEVASISIRGGSRANENGGPAPSHVPSRQISIAGAARSDTFSGRELLSAPSHDIPSPDASTVPEHPSREASQKKWAEAATSEKASLAPVRSLQDRLAPTTPRSLADRIGDASTGRGKRRREGDSAVTPSVGSSRPALVDRISSSNDVNASRDTKKARTSLPSSVDTKSSLLSRMSGGPGTAPSTPSTGLLSTPSAGGAPGTEISIRNASAVRNASPATGFSIKGATPTPSPLTAQRTDYFPTQTQSTAAAVPIPDLAKTMSIKSASATGNGPASTPATAPTNPDEGIRRKGRGFNKNEEGAAVFQLPTPASGASTAAGLGQRVGGGGLASRLSGRR